MTWDFFFDNQQVKSPLFNLDQLQRRQALNSSHLLRSLQLWYQRIGGLASRSQNGPCSTAHGNLVKGSSFSKQFLAGYLVLMVPGKNIISSICNLFLFPGSVALLFIATSCNREGLIDVIANSLGEACVPHSPNRPSPCGDFVGFLPGASWLNTWLSDESDEVDVSEVLNILSNEVIQQVSPEQKHGKNYGDGATKMIGRYM